jgi:DNA repair exonuclease SbcCD ATPase subunit
VDSRKNLSRRLMVRLTPFASFAGLGTFAILGESYILAGLLGIGAFVTGRRLLDRRENRRKELLSRARHNRGELGRVAREDRIAASQMKRLVALQDGLLESWELLPEECRPLLDEDIFTIVGEVEGAARLARRRAALRRHLESVDRHSIHSRIQELQKDLSRLEPESPMRAPFESALQGRRGELAGYHDALGGISMINAQLESAESLLGNLRGELLALDGSIVSGPQDPGLAQLKERIAYFRHGLDEVTRRVETLPATERMSAR